MDDSLNLPVIGDYLNIGHWSTRGLVGYYPFARAENLVDFTLNRNHGAITGAIWAGNALSFDGANSGVEIISFKGSNADTASCIFWLYYKSSTTNDGFVTTDSRSPVIYDVGGNMSVIWGVFPERYSFSIGVIPFNVWVCYAFTYQRGVGVKGYKNGIFIGEDTTGGLEDISPIDNLFIGTDTGISGRSIDGLMRNVLVYNRTLSASEIQQLMLNPNLPIQREPIWWGQGEAVVGAKMAAHYYRHLMQGVA